MATMNISLPDSLRAAVDNRIADGRFANASDYMRDLIRRDLEAEKLQRLHDAIDVGLNSGPPKDFDPQKLLKKIKAKHLK